MEMGCDVSDDDLEQRMHQQAPNKCCTLIFTVGCCLLLILTSGRLLLSLLCYQSEMLCEMCRSRPALCCFFMCSPERRASRKA